MTLPHKDVIPVSVTNFSISSSIKSFANKARATKGLRRYAAAFAFGSLCSIAYAPINFFPVLWIGFPALFLIMQGVKDWRAAFITGWSFAFGCFVFSFYWITAAMFVDIAQFWWAVPLALVGLPIFFAIYYGLAMMVFHRLQLKGFSAVVVFALIWFLADYARGHVFTGFPWNLEAYAWGRVLPVMQSVSLIGSYGLTLITILAATLPVLLANNIKTNRHIVVTSILALIAIACWGEWRLQHAENAFVPDVRLRLVQPNTDQANKWEMSQLEGNFRHLLDLTSAPAAKPVTHIIWPETAATFYLAEDTVRRRIVASHVPQGGALLTGVIRRSLDDQQKLHYYNSLVAVDSNARIDAGYDKYHLVPFGEYIPVRKFLPLRTLANLGLDFSSGDGHRSLHVQGLPPFSPLICYEAIFPGEVIDSADRPEFIVNVTNDGWYSQTAGPYQHFSIVRLRAIEEGLPLVRAANTGISAVVDGYGRIIARMGLAKGGSVDSDLPQALPPTFFSHYGETPLWIMFFALVLGVLLIEYKYIGRKR